MDVGVWGNTWVLPAWLRLYQKFIIKDSGSKATFPMASAVFDWVQKRGGHLFLYINVTEPHQEYVPHEPYYSDFSQGLRLDTLANRARLRYLCKTRDLVLFDSTKFSGFTDDDYRYLKSVYDSELAYMDANFGGFSQNLRKSGLLDQTLLVITADHGEFLGEYWTVGHPELLLNPVLRIPLILRYPDLIEPRVRRDLTSNVDIFPTVLNLLGYEETIPPDVEGYDLLQAFPAGNRLVLSANAKNDEGVYSIVDGRYKLIVNADSYLPRYFPYDTLLFDLQSDPEERHNLFSADPDAAARLSTALEEWSARIKVRSKDSITISEETIENLKALGYVH